LSIAEKEKAASERERESEAAHKERENELESEIQKGRERLLELERGFEKLRAEAKQVSEAEVASRSAAEKERDGLRASIADLERARDETVKERDGLRASVADLQAAVDGGKAVRDDIATQIETLRKEAKKEREVMSPPPATTNPQINLFLTMIFYVFFAGYEELDCES